jgi:hypothetical protein
MRPRLATGPVLGAVAVAAALPLMPLVLDPLSVVDDEDYLPGLAEANPAGGIGGGAGRPLLIIGWSLGEGVVLLLPAIPSLVTAPSGASAKGRSRRRYRLPNRPQCPT